jgi:hypothetical protein
MESVLFASGLLLLGGALGIYLRFNKPHIEPAPEISDANEKDRVSPSFRHFPQLSKKLNRPQENENSAPERLLSNTFDIESKARVREMMNRIQSLSGSKN